MTILSFSSFAFLASWLLLWSRWSLLLKLLSWWLVLGEDKRVADRPGEGNRMVEDTEDTDHHNRKVGKVDSRLHLVA